MIQQVKMPVPAQPTAPETGFITIAFGDRRYLRQAENLARSLRHHMPGYPIALVTDSTSPSSALFDHIIPMAEGWGRGVIQKLQLYQYSPFERTLYIDSDCICMREFTEQLALLEGHAFTAVGSQYAYPGCGQSETYLDDLDHTLEQLDISRFPKFNGGIYYFERGEAAEALFAKAHALFASREVFGLKDFDRAGPNEETIFALAMEVCRQACFRDHGRLMRTPLGVTGRIRLDPLEAGCSFKKGEIIMRPALLHFCGPLVKTLEYRYSAWVFRRRLPKPLYRCSRSILGLAQWLISVPIQHLMYNPRISAIYYRMKASGLKKSEK